MIFILKVPEPGPDIVAVQVSGIPGANYGQIDLFDEQGEGPRPVRERGPERTEELTRMKVAPGTYVLRVVLPAKNKLGSEYTLYAGKPQKPPASPVEVQQALVKALDWLASKQEKDGSWKGHREAYTGLSLMAFIGSQVVAEGLFGEYRVRRSLPQIRLETGLQLPEGSKEAAERRRGPARRSGNMYQHAIATLALIEALVDIERRRASSPIARDAVDLIVRSQNTENKPESLRGPGPAGLPVLRRLEVQSEQHR